MKEVSIQSRHYLNVDKADLQLLNFEEKPERTQELHICEVTSYQAEGASILRENKG